MGIICWGCKGVNKTLQSLCLHWNIWTYPSSAAHCHSYSNSAPSQGWFPKTWRQQMPPLLAMKISLALWCWTAQIYVCCPTLVIIMYSPTWLWCGPDHGLKQADIDPSIEKLRPMNKESLVWTWSGSCSSCRIVGGWDRLKLLRAQQHTSSVVITKIYNPVCMERLDKWIGMHWRS